jgi:hypothetical protein
MDLGNTCGTAGGTAGTVGDNAVGVAGAGAGELVVAAGYAGQAPGTTAFSGHTAVTEVTQTANQNPADDTYFQWRVALTSPFVYDGIQNPNVTVAFGTDTALTFTDSGTCVAYASAPDVTITIN